MKIFKDEILNNRLITASVLDGARLIDIHNHTTWSDGSNSASELIEHAIQNGVEVVGISDHLITYPNRLIDLDAYINELLILKEKFKDKINILMGIEIYPFPISQTFENMDYKNINRLDYVLIENLDNVSKLLDLDKLESYLSKINCLVGLAHTDLIKWSSNLSSLEAICDFISRNKLFWEINSSSEYAFYDDIISNNSVCRSFIQKLHKYRIPILAGSDTHSLDDYEHGRLIKANEFAKHFKYFNLPNSV